MHWTRREFIGSSLVATAGLLAGCAAPGSRHASLPDDDGYRLWLRYEESPRAQEYRRVVREIVVEADTPSAQVVARELRNGISGLLGKAVPVARTWSGQPAVIAGTPSSSAVVRDLGVEAELARLGAEGYLIRSTTLRNQPVIVIASAGDAGVLYGAFHLLRLFQTAQPLRQLSVAERPRVQLRLQNHWDNLNGSIERGYAGRSLWQWDELPGTISPRYVDYARANASVGINGSVINNVNANPRILTRDYLVKVAALADAWRPYHVRMYLSVNFASPMRIGGLQTADPLDPKVAEWWKAKVQEIYQLIPDFGGFLVKANSEGQPGPKDYGRSHAEGANMLADALAPHGGNVIWRAFVYDEDVDPDRVKRAYIEFTRLDGQFRPNAIVQVKNGPIDFQPREPFHPLFGAMRQTPLFAELQATQEYLGQAKHLVYLGTMWKEFLDSDTHAKGEGSTVGRVLEGAVHPSRITGMVSVTNPGLDTNWCGHHFSQSNWYAFGRLAWNHSLSAEAIAEEWTRMTFTNDQSVVREICDMMMSSWGTYVNYTMPVGLNHLIGGDHYAPMPENARAPRADWTATYFHRASADGIGYDRTRRGNKAVEQYFPPVCDLFDNVATCPEKFLLWFHRLPWDYRVKSGRTLWEELCAKYYMGAAQAEDLKKRWEALAGRIDAQRHLEVADRLSTQVRDSARWRDHVLTYFKQFSGREIKPPAGVTA